MPDTITDSQDEQSLDGLLRDSDQIHIPVFQREYKWGKPEFDELLEDIHRIRLGKENVQFLGAIVSYERPRPREVTGRLRAIDIVDGQQRLLTLYIFVMAIAEFMLPDDVSLAAQTARDYLLLPHRSGLPVNTRIVPSYSDRAQFRRLWEQLMKGDGFVSKLSEDLPTLPTTMGNWDGKLVAQHNRITRFLRTQVKEFTATERRSVLQELLTIVGEKLTFVVLELKDASTATKIFERLNFRGKKVGIVDLVRNEIFSRVGEEPERATKVFNNLWIPFQERFDTRAEHFFFPYTLIHDSNTKKSELFRGLRRIWGSRSPSQIIDHMRPYQVPFLALDGGLPLADPDIDLRLDRLKRLGRPSSVYPFLMRLLHSHQHDGTETSVVIDVLDLVESFLVRRAIAGYEPTGLHAVFKGLWNEVETNLSVVTVSSAIRKRRTIQWPADAELREAVHLRDIAAARVCKYVIVEHDKYLKGDDPDGEPTIEHVMPRSRDAGSAWAEAFTSTEHRKLLHTWANLIPLSKPLNDSIQRAPYSTKRERYLAESMYVTPRWIAKNIPEWTPQVLAERAALLGDWAVHRWPYSPDTEN